MKPWSAFPQQNSYKLQRQIKPCELTLKSKLTYIWKKLNDFNKHSKLLFSKTSSSLFTYIILLIKPVFQEQQNAKPTVSGNTFIDLMGENVQHQQNCLFPPQSFNRNSKIEKK